MNGVTGDFNIEVKDWNEGEIVTVPDGNLDITYTDKDLGKIGDYVYLTDGKLEFSDGGLRKSSLNGTLTWEKTMPNPITGKTCIGIVFSNKMSDKDKAKGWTGYAIAPEHIANEGEVWAKEGYTGDNDQIPNCPIIKDLVNDRDGYTYCQLFAQSIDNYPIYEKVVKTMNTKAKLPEETSGWYVPSAGLICDMFYNLSGMTVFHTSYQNDNIAKSNNGGNQVLRDFGFGANKINAFTQRAVGKDLTFTCNICTCSEIEKTDGAYINITNDYKVKLCGYMNKGDKNYHSFAVFAFPKPQPPTP